MKTTLEIPDPLFRQVKATAASHGQSLKAFFVEALTTKLAALPSAPAKPWMSHFGALGHLHDDRAELEKRMSGEFESIDHAAWK